LKFSRDEDDPAGLSHCAQLDVRRYAQGVRRLVYSTAPRPAGS
jgi:hypothetical protein